MSLRFRPSDNHRRDIVGIFSPIFSHPTVKLLTVDSIKTDWFNDVLLKDTYLNSSDFYVQGLAKTRPVYFHFSDIRPIPETKDNLKEIDFVISYEFKRKLSVYDYEEIDSMDAEIFSTVLTMLNEQVKSTFDFTCRFTDKS